MGHSMRQVKVLLKFIEVTLLLIFCMNLGYLEAATKPKPKPQRERAVENAIVGEADDIDNEPTVDEADEAVGLGVEDEAPLMKGPTSEIKDRMSPFSDLKKPQKSKKSVIPDKKRAQLMEGFKQAEEFHKKWHHLSKKAINTSHDKLTKFCKTACTPKNCKDAEIADNCHLICPDATKKNCPDPLEGRVPMHEEEEGPVNRDVHSAMKLADESHVQDPISPVKSYPQKIDMDEEG